MWDVGLDASVCPLCGAASSHPVDLAEGYCGACRAYTREHAPTTAALHATFRMGFSRGVSAAYAVSTGPAGLQVLHPYPPAAGVSVRSWVREWLVRGDAARRLSAARLDDPFDDLRIPHADSPGQIVVDDDEVRRWPTAKPAARPRWRDPHSFHLHITMMPTAGSAGLPELDGLKPKRWADGEPIPQIRFSRSESGSPVFVFPLFPPAPVAAGQQVGRTQFYRAGAPITVSTASVDVDPGQWPPSPYLTTVHLGGEQVWAWTYATRAAARVGHRQVAATIRGEQRWRRAAWTAGRRQR